MKKYFYYHPEGCQLAFKNNNDIEVIGEIQEVDVKINAKGKTVTYTVIIGNETVKVDGEIYRQINN